MECPMHKAPTKATAGAAEGRYGEQTLQLQPWLSVGLVSDWSCVCHSAAAAPYPTLEHIRETQELGLWLL